MHGQPSLFTLRLCQSPPLPTSHPSNFTHPHWDLNLAGVGLQQIIFYWVYASYHYYSLISWWTSRLFSFLCHWLLLTEQQWMWMSKWIYSRIKSPLRIFPGSLTAVSFGRSMSSFLWCLNTDSQHRRWVWNTHNSTSEVKLARFSGWLLPVPWKYKTSSLLSKLVKRAFLLDSHVRRCFKTPLLCR